MDDSFNLKSHFIGIYVLAKKTFCMLYRLWSSISFWRVQGTEQILPTYSFESRWLSGEQFCTSFSQALTAISIRFLY